MEPTQELIDELYMDKVRQARAMTEKQRLEAGGELFDYACAISECGIRSDRPDATAEEVLAEVRRRVAIGERLEQMRFEEHQARRGVG